MAIVCPRFVSLLFVVVVFRRFCLRDYCVSSLFVVVVSRRWFSWLLFFVVVVRRRLSSMFIVVVFRGCLSSWFAVIVFRRCLSSLFVVGVCHRSVSLLCVVGVFRCCFSGLLLSLFVVVISSCCFSLLLFVDVVLLFDFSDLSDHVYRNSYLPTCRAVVTLRFAKLGAIIFSCCL